MPDFRDSTQPQVIGEKVLDAAVALARETWTDRLIAAYALGSLAHGGFSVHVSDVDFGLVLSDPLEDRDAASVSDLSSSLKASGAPLADRLSVFWGSPATLSGLATGGRFPPLDRLDLKQFGRLLAGRDIRDQLPPPSLKELVVIGAEFSLKRLSTREVTAKLKNPAALAGSDLKTLTKLILYPVRFVFTARTGEVGRNESAVDYLTGVTAGSAAELARTALAWRYTPPDPRDHATLDVIERGLLPLYRMFLDDYEVRLRNYGQRDLADAFRMWREQLETWNSVER